MYSSVTKNWLLCKFLCEKAVFTCLWTVASSSFKANKYTGDKMEDGALPNNEWSKDSIELFNQLSEMGSGWKKLYRDISTSPDDGSRNFMNAVNDEPGKFIEYAFFHNAKLKCTKTVVQFGPYCRGPVGHVHGGAIATILDSVMGVCAMFSGYKSQTANLTVDYKRPLPLNTTTLVEATIDKIEGRKVFVSAAIKTVDGCEIYSEGTSLYIMPKLNASL